MIRAFIYLTSINHKSTFLQDTNPMISSYGVQRVSKIIQAFKVAQLL
jgi:hypothetical protein